MGNKIVNDFDDLSESFEKNYYSAFIYEPHRKNHIFSISKNNEKKKIK